MLTFETLYQRKGIIMDRTNRLTALMLFALVLTAFLLAGCAMPATMIRKSSTNRAPKWQTGPFTVALERVDGRGGPA